MEQCSKQKDFRPQLMIRGRKFFGVIFEYGEVPRNLIFYSRIMQTRNDISLHKAVLSWGILMNPKKREIVNIKKMINIASGEDLFCRFTTFAINI